MTTFWIVVTILVALLLIVLRQPVSRLLARLSQQSRPSGATPAVPNDTKLDPRLRTLLEYDRSELVRMKREDDRLRREELDAIRVLGEEARRSHGVTEKFERLAAEIRQRVAAFPVFSTFGLYLPEEPDAVRVSTLNVPFVSATIRSEASAQDLAALGLQVRSQAGNIFTVYLPLELCGRLSLSAAIDYVELARPYAPQLVNAIPKTRIDQIHANGTTGAGVVVGIIDSGLDFYHEHFRHGDGSTRVLYMWDQTLNPQGGESSPPVGPALSGFNPFGGSSYGVEYNQAQINSELANGLPAYLLVRSNPGTGHYGEGSHGTLVASCAAGSGHVDQNGQKVYVGAASKADIIHVRTDNLGNHDVYADSTNILDAFSYVFARALALQRPCVVNLSSSDNLSGHDGSTNGEQFLDNLLLKPGRAITCSAGNVNGLDLHTKGSVAQGGTTAVNLVYSAAPLAARNDDTIQLWYDGHDEFTVTLTVPTPVPTVIGPVAAGSSSPTTTVGGVKVVVASGPYANNGDNLVEVRITGVSAANPIPAGTWILSLYGTTVINGAFDAWVDRNNLGKVGWQNPVTDEGTMGAPATARRPVSVGAHHNDGAICGTPGGVTPTIINISGCGPTRDGRIKPEVAAPGEVSGAMSRDMNQPLPPGYPITLGLSGTSNAAPIVAGAAALLFECKGGGLTAADIKQLLVNAAKPPSAGVPSTAFGFGYLCAEGMCAAPAPSVDVWLRDSPTDTGVEPYVGGVTWLSPDIGVLDAAGNPTPNPTYDPANLWNALIDLTVRNRGTQTARNIDVFLYWADPETNIPFPSEWRSSGIFTGPPAFVQQGNRIVIPQLLAGAHTTVRFAWAPPAPGSNIRGDDHFCLVARVEHEADPSNVNAGGWPVVAGSNNIGLRNVHVQDGSGVDATAGFFVVGSQDVDALELSCERLAGDIELFLPTRALPWHELALLERRKGHRPVYGSPCGRDPAEEIRRILTGDEVARILDVTGAERAHVEGATTRLVAAGRNNPHLVLAQVRVQQGVKMPVRVWARNPELEEGVGRVHVGQRSGGKLIGGVSLELRSHLAAAREYDVRRRGDEVEVTPRRLAKGF